MYVGIRNWERVVRRRFCRNRRRFFAVFSILLVSADVAVSSSSSEDDAVVDEPAGAFVGQRLEESDLVSCPCRRASVGTRRLPLRARHRTLNSRPFIFSKARHRTYYQTNFSPPDSASSSRADAQLYARNKMRRPTGFGERYNTTAGVSLILLLFFFHDTPSHVHMRLCSPLVVGKTISYFSLFNDHPCSLQCILLAGSVEQKATTTVDQRVSEVRGEAQQSLSDLKQKLADLSEYVECDISMQKNRVDVLGVRVAELAGGVAQANAQAEAQQRLGKQAGEDVGGSAAELSRELAAERVFLFIMPEQSCFRWKVVSSVLSVVSIRFSAFSCTNVTVIVHDNKHFYDNHR